MKRTTILITGALAALTLGGVAIAGGHGGPGGHFMGRVIQELDLSPEQEEAAKALREEAKEDRAAARSEGEKIQDAIFAELSQAEPNRRKVHALIDEGAELRAQQAHQHMDSMMDFIELLDAEQKATLVERMEQGRERRREHKGRRGGRHHGGGHGFGE